ncbi:Metallo-dependent phosphatase [Leucogyrophana mollusca]|uniref:Metallo-dependent phosphatase n=1 Tax=Leucogyrophana mollusca TaxID=85980 RepID=A0ACB8BR37_9AGAM|nr:Metallo-dependent phosphatase [Leucogyrophana mollusca]
MYANNWDSDYPTESFRTSSAIVHTSYDPTNPPPHPGADWTRFICISDTHSQTFQIPPGDVLLHSGDLSRKGRKGELKVTIDWLREQTHPVKIIIAGNHDLPLHEEWYEMEHKEFHEHKESTSEVRDVVDSQINREHGIIYLQDEKHSFCAKSGGRVWTVYGFPWQPYFGGWAFNYDFGDEAKSRVSTIPEVDILLTHGPPHMILDRALHGGHVGCPALLSHISRMQKPPLLHVFGHIHEAHGALAHPWVVDPALPSESLEHLGLNESPRETVMVNAANLPLGPKARTLWGRRIPCGGIGFQPVIVDLLDAVHR